MRDMITTTDGTMKWIEMPDTGHAYKWKQQLDMMDFFLKHPRKN
jgi:hypothetical protein